ncbi:50S ribosomal protein L4 [Candidatus Sumerlaeota bacterium]|nr:50S ribosomal protein L4 [Candidatus Sumerlaeota bacterium]
MAQLPVINSQGKERKPLEVSDEIFAAPVKAHVIRLAVNAQLANRRQGNSSSKNRTAVRGGGRKPFRQKGTGRARQGTTRAPHMRGGAVAFGPQPRSWRQRLNRKVRRQALVGALSSLAGEGAIRVVEDFGITEPKTREMAALLGRIGADTERVLILLAEADRSVALSARNLPWAKVASTDELNVVDLVTHDQVLATEAAVRAIEAKLSGPIRGTADAEVKVS